MQVFLVISTCLLYLIAAGLFSRAVGYFQQQQWNNIVGGDTQELGTGAGTYDVDKVVWHVNVRSSLLLFPTFFFPLFYHHSQSHDACARHWLD